MEKLYFRAGKDDAGRRFDRVLRTFLEEKGMSDIYKALRKGLIRVNGHKVQPDYKVEEYDEISIAAFIMDDSRNGAELPSLNNPAGGKFSIHTVFENAHLKIINKPYDVSVHGRDSLESVMNHELHPSCTSLSFKPGPLHRLDRKTTGLLAYSLSIEGARWFSAAISEHVVKKYYIGISQGKIDAACHWNDMITSEKNRGSSFYMMKESSGDSENERLAETTAVPLAYGSYGGVNVTLTQFQIMTGVKHQIRLQSSIHGFPLLGDTAYGGRKIHEKQDFFLHALELHFPESNPLELPLVLRAEMTGDFAAVMKKALIKWDCRTIIF